MNFRYLSCVSTTLQKAQRRCMATAGPKTMIKFTMSDYPVPQGSWQTAHAIKQRRYNTYLILASIVFLSTVTFFTQSGIIYFGLGPTIGYEKKDKA